MNVSFRQLKLFKALADTGSVTAAARVMHVTQPTASMQLRELSEAVGTALFEVIAKKVYLTEAGKMLAATANSIAHEWETFEQSMSAMQGRTTGTLSISVVSTAKYFIPKLLGRFCEQYPSVDIHLQVLNRDAVVARLESNLDDMVIMSKPPAHLDIHDEIFMENPLVCIAPKGHKLAKQRLHLRDLAHEYFVMREMGSGTRMSCDLFFKQKKFQPNIRLSLGSNEAVKLSVAGGLGLAIVSVHALSKEDLRDSIQILDVKELPIRSQWHIVTLKGKRLSPIASVYHDHLIQQSKLISAEWQG
jgi:DNA-binding transcriptional LysR family regulator